MNPQPGAREQQWDRGGAKGCHATIKRIGGGGAQAGEKTNQTAIRQCAADTEHANWANGRGDRNSERKPTHCEGKQAKQSGEHSENSSSRRAQRAGRDKRSARYLIGRGLAGAVERWLTVNREFAKLPRPPRERLALLEGGGAGNARGHSGKCAHRCHSSRSKSHSIFPEQRGALRARCRPQHKRHVTRMSMSACGARLRI